MDINTNFNSVLSGLSPAADTALTPSIPDTGSTGPSFKDTVKQMLGDVNAKVNESDQLSRDYAAGRTNDVSKVVTSVEEANLAMQFTLAVRNKLMDAYTEISRMQL